MFGHADISHLPGLWQVKPKVALNLALTLAIALLSSGCLPLALRNSCEAFRTIQEQRACERGRVRAEAEKMREKVYRAERYGYERYRQRQSF